MNRRKVVFDLLKNWSEQKRFIEHVFESHLFSRDDLEMRDRKWIQSSILGVIEHYFACEFFLQKLTRKKFKRNKADIKLVLLCGTYELLFSKNEAHAIVNEWVRLVKSYGYRFETKVVNGVLREVGRRKAELLKDYQNTSDFKIKYNIPPEVHKLLVKEYSEKDLIAWYNYLKKGEKDYWIRFNYLREKKESRFEAVTNLIPFLDDLKNGMLSIQDRAAGKVVEYMAPKKGMRILDYCSAPGTKSSYIAELTDDKAEIIASDRDERRLEKVKENATRLGLNSIQIKSLEELTRDTRTFDQVLLDLPCSGLGTVKKRSDLLYYFSLEKLDDLNTLQNDILNAAKSFVRIDGELIISTCTILKRENMDLVDYFLEKNKDFKQIEEALYCLPFDGKTDASFAVKLKRER